nr:hypothetical protein [Pseudomonas sp. UBA6718]
MIYAHLVPELLHKALIPLVTCAEPLKITQSAAQIGSTPFTRSVDLAMHHNPVSYLCAFFSLIGIKTFFLGAAQRSDFRWLLRNQADLFQLPPEQLTIRENECKGSTARRCVSLRNKTLLSLAWVLSAIALAYLMLFQHFEISSLTRQHGFAVASLIAFSWATLGRLGWSDQSFKGTTIFERLDVFLFWLLYWLGTCFGVVATLNA